MPKGGPQPGSGRKSKAEEAGLNALIDSAWPDEEKLKTFKILVSFANAGNTAAAQLLLAYRFGKPRERVDVTSGGAKVAAVVYLPAKDDGDSGD